MYSQDKSIDGCLLRKVYNYVIYVMKFFLDDVDYLQASESMPQGKIL